MKTTSLTTAFTQNVPNFEASDALHHPSIDRNNTSPSITTPTAPTVAPPLRSYAIIPTPTWGRTSVFTITQTTPTPTPSSDSSTTFYTALIQRAHHGFGDSQVLLQKPSSTSFSPSQNPNSTATTLATCRLRGWKSQKFLFLGPHPDCTDPADWIPVTASGNFDPSKYFFQVGECGYAWVRTRRKDLGKCGWVGKNFKLVRLGVGVRGGVGGSGGGKDRGDGKGEVLAVYVHVGKWKSRDEGRVDWFCDGVEVDVERSAIVAMLGLQEEFRRKE